MERLKAHANLRRYIEYEVDQANNSEAFSNIKRTVRENLQAIETQIKKNKLFSKYSSLAKQAHEEKKKAQHILQPSRPFDIENLVSTWFASAEKEETDKDFHFIFSNAMKDKHISISNLTGYAIYARLSLLLRLDVFHLLQFQRNF